MKKEQITEEMLQKIEGSLDDIKRYHASTTLNKDLKEKVDGLKKELEYYKNYALSLHLDMDKLQSLNEKLENCAAEQEEELNKIEIENTKMSDLILRLWNEFNEASDSIFSLDNHPLTNKIDKLHMRTIYLENYIAEIEEENMELHQENHMLKEEIDLINSRIIAIKVR